MNRIAKTLSLLVILGVLLYLAGIALNTVVKFANDGYMPVMISEEDEYHYLITDDKKHRLQKDGKLFLLSDRIDVDLPPFEKYTSDDIFGRIVKNLVQRFNLPFTPEDRYITASIGDIIQWIGLLMVLLFTPILIMFILLMIKKNINAGKNWRE